MARAKAQAREKKKKEAHTTEKHEKAYCPVAEHISFSRRVDVVVVAFRFIVGYGIVRRQVDLFEGLSHGADIRRRSTAAFPRHSRYSSNAVVLR